MVCMLLFFDLFVQKYLEIHVNISLTPKWALKLFIELISKFAKSH